MFEREKLLIARLAALGIFALACVAAPQRATAAPSSTPRKVPWPVSATARAAPIESTIRYAWVLRFLGDSDTLAYYTAAGMRGGVETSLESNPIAVTTPPCTPPPGVPAGRDRWCRISQYTALYPDVDVKLTKIPWSADLAKAKESGGMGITEEIFRQFPDTAMVWGLPSEWALESNVIATDAALKRALDWMGMAALSSATFNDPVPMHLHPEIGLRIFVPRRAMRPSANDIGQRQVHGLWAYRMAHLIGRLNMETSIQYARQHPPTLHMWTGPLLGGGIERLAVLLARGSLVQASAELSEDPFDANWVRLKIINDADLAIEFNRIHRDWRFIENVVTLLQKWDDPDYQVWHDYIEGMSGIPERSEDIPEIYQKPTLAEWIARARDINITAASIAGAAFGIPPTFLLGGVMDAAKSAGSWLLGAVEDVMSGDNTRAEMLPPDPDFESRLEEIGYWAARAANTINPFGDLTRRLYNYSRIPIDKELAKQWTAEFQSRLVKTISATITSSKPRLDSTEATALLLSRWSLAFLKWEKWIMGAPAEDATAAKARFTATKKKFDDARALLATQMVPEKRTGLVKAIAKRNPFATAIAPYPDQENFENAIKLFFDTMADDFFPPTATPGISLSTFAGGTMVPLWRNWTPPSSAPAATQAPAK